MDEPELLKTSPVDAAILYSSPLITCRQFKEQCRDIILHQEHLSKSERTKFSPVNEKSLNKPDATENSVEQNSEKNTVKKKEESSTNEELAFLLNTDLTTIEELEEVCSVNNLKCDLDDKHDYWKLRVYDEFPDEVPLHTVRMAKQNKMKLEDTMYAPFFAQQPAPDENDVNEEKLENGEVILLVSVGHAQKRKVSQEFYVLPRTTLAELRDVMTCPSDMMVIGEHSNNPSLLGIQTAKERYGSSFFYIEECFYNDMRNPLNRDYSQVIIEWAREPERYTAPGLGLLKSAKMEETTFENLQIRLGYPYLFCHQGDCEHILVFKDMRIVNKENPQYLKYYPYKYYEAVKRRRKCSICNIHLVKWATMNDELAFEDPSFFCEKCFRYLHYKENGEKICNFQAYPYTEIE